MWIGSGSNAPPICFTKNKSSIMSKPSAKQHTAKYDEHTIETPATLMEFLTSTYEGRSRTTVKSYLTHGQVTVGGVVKTKFDTPLTAGDIVRVTFGHVEKPFTHKMLRIVYEDDDLIVIDKRNGLLSMASERERVKTAYYILSEYLKSRDRSARIFIVHRLDRETSGLMLFAKSMEVQHAFQILPEQIPELHEDEARLYQTALQYGVAAVFVGWLKDEGEPDWPAILWRA